MKFESMGDPIDFTCPFRVMFTVYPSDPWATPYVATFEDLALNLLVRKIGPIKDREEALQLFKKWCSKRTNWNWEHKPILYIRQEISSFDQITK